MAGTIASSYSSRGMHSGSSNARLGLSQKGDLPSSGARGLSSFGPRSPVRAKDPNGERPRYRPRDQGLPRPWGLRRVVIS
jgi:hypothetical protein